MGHQGIETIRALLAEGGFGEGTIDDRRATLEAVAGSTPPPDGVVVETDTVGGRPAEWLRPADVDAADRGAVLLYLHGGGYCSGSLNTHRSLAGRLAAACGFSVCNLDYRLAPEHPHPAAIDDATAAFLELVDRGHDASRLAVAGDSAGGGLTMATLVALRDAEGAVPGAAVCLSPWIDLTQSTPSYGSRAALDPMCSKEGLDLYAAAYLGDTDPEDPLASPAYADLGELPPIKIEVGDAEVLLDESVRMADDLEAHGVEVDLTVWPEMIHVFQAFPGQLVPEADESIAAIAAFLRQHLI